MSETPEGELELLRGYELRLLRCTLSPPLPSTPQEHSLFSCQTNDIHALIDHLVSSVESGDYQGALTSKWVQQAFRLSTGNCVNSIESANRIYSELQERVEQFVVQDSANEVDRIRRAVLVMAMAVAAILVFNQCNLTGSVLVKSSRFFELYSGDQ